MHIISILLAFSRLLFSFYILEVEQCSFPFKIEMIFFFSCVSETKFGSLKLVLSGSVVIIAFACLKKKWFCRNNGIKREASLLYCSLLM